MVTYFNKKDLVQFGQYLLSDERRESILFNYNPDEEIPLKEKIKKVYHADVENFLNKIKKIE